MDTQKRGRKNEIADQYLVLLDAHMRELRTGQAARALEINDFARQLHIHPRHLSNTINEVLNCSPCNLYEERLLAVAQEMLINDNSSIAAIARTYSTPHQTSRNSSKPIQVSPRASTGSNTRWKILNYSPRSRTDTYRHLP